jgi:hypothetical protein
VYQRWDQFSNGEQASHVNQSLPPLAKHLDHWYDETLQAVFNLHMTFLYFTEFIGLMAPDISIPDILNFYTKIDEEHVTVDPEELKQKQSFVLDEDVQSQAKKFFTEDAWLGVMNTLKALAADSGKL